MALSLLLFAIGFSIMHELMGAMHHFVPWLLRLVERWRSCSSVRRLIRLQKAQDRDLLPLVRHRLSDEDLAQACTALRFRGCDILATWGTEISIGRPLKGVQATDGEILEILRRATPDIHWVSAGKTPGMWCFSSYGEPPAGRGDAASCGGMKGRPPQSQAEIDRKQRDASLGRGVGSAATAQ